MCERHGNDQSATCLFVEGWKIFQKLIIGGGGDYSVHYRPIKSKTGTNSYFELNPIVEEDMIKEILGLISRKSVSGSIPIKALKLGVFECFNALTKLFNDNVLTHNVKLADIIPVHKKGSTTNKANHKPISLLTVVSKVFERQIPSTPRMIVLF